MRIIPFFCLAIISLQSFSIACTSKPCPGKTGSSSEANLMANGDLGNPGKKGRRKRAIDSESRQLADTLAPFARLTNALTLQSTLYDPKAKIEHIVAEFLNIDHIPMDMILNFRSENTSNMLQNLRTMANHKEADVDSILTGIDEILKIEEDYKQSMSNPVNEQNLGQAIYDVYEYGFEEYKISLSDVNKTLEQIAKLEKTTYGTSDSDKKPLVEISTKLLPSITITCSNLDQVRRGIEKLKNVAFMKSEFDPLKNRIQLHQRIFKKVKSSFDSVKVLKMDTILQNSARPLEGQSVLENIRYIKWLAEGKSPKSYPRTYTSAFVTGASDLKLLKEDFKGFVHRDVLHQGIADDIENSLKPLVKFGEDVEKARSIIWNEALTSKLQEDSELLLNDFLKMTPLGNAEDFRSDVNAVADKLFKTIELNSTLISNFHEMYNTLDSAKNEKDANLNEIKAFIENDDVKWLMDNNQKVNQLSNSDITESAYNTLKSELQDKAVPALQEIQRTLPKLKTFAEKLEPLVNKLGYIKFTTNAINQNMKYAVVQLLEGGWRDKLKKVRQVVAVVKDQLTLINSPGFDNRKDSLDKFRSTVEAEIGKIKTSLTQNQKSKKPLILEIWPEWGSTKRIEDKLIGGYILFDRIDKVQGREVDLKDMGAKSYEVYEQMEYNKETISIPRDVREKMGDMFKHRQWIDTMFNEIGILDGKIASVDVSNLKSVENSIMDATFVTSPEYQTYNLYHVFEMLKSTELDQTKVKNAQDATKKVQDLSLDWAQYRKVYPSTNYIPVLTHFVKGVYKQRDAREVKKKNENAWYPDSQYIKENALWAVLLFLPFYYLYLLIATKIGAYIYWVVFDKKKEKQLALLDGLSVMEYKVEYKQEEYADFGDTMELYDQHLDQVREAWKSTAPEKDRDNRFDFICLLMDKEKATGESIEIIIRKIAEKIQNVYVEHRGKIAADVERGDYFFNEEGNLLSSRKRLFRCMNSDNNSTDIWRWLFKFNFHSLIDMNNLWCPDNQSELCLNIRKHPTYQKLFVATERQCPFRNLRLFEIEQVKPHKKMLYWKYQNMPCGFAPFELTPTQIMYENFANAGKPDDIHVGCMDRDADTRSCLFALIDTLMDYIMHCNDIDKDFDQVGLEMANERWRSLDLVTTVQIEFAFYVCLKIINDENREHLTMFTRDKTWFLRDIEDAWASAWLYNYEKFQKYWDAKDFNREYIAEDREYHWYPQTKHKYEEIKEQVVQFVEARREFYRTTGLDDPYAKKGEMKEDKKNK